MIIKIINIELEITIKLYFTDLFVSKNINKIDILKKKKEVLPPLIKTKPHNSIIKISDIKFDSNF